MLPNPTIVNLQEYGLILILKLNDLKHNESRKDLRLMIYDLGMIQERDQYTVFSFWIRGRDY
jgi:hypothetical protein